MSVRIFNVAGPCRPERHYMLPPQPRLPQAHELIEHGQYFVVHAPRQTGKTTTLQALAQELTTSGRYAVVYLSCEGASARAQGNATPEELILAAISDGAGYSGLPDACRPPDPWPAAPSGHRLFRGLTAWAAASPLPLVLLLDEIDSLVGDHLTSVLRQLRAGHNAPTPFAHSVVLCGMRDVRDYKAASGGDPTRLASSSPFNIKAASLRLENFSFDQMADLYGQHTTETGQKFTEHALQRAFEASQGQPWLVNALASEVIRNMRILPPEPITDEHMEEAIERLIVARATHLDSLVARLAEPRIQRIIEPVIVGDQIPVDSAFNDDLAYIRDLGLVTRTHPLQVSNPIYQEVILRVLAERTESLVHAEPKSFLTSDGRLDFDRLLEEFAAFWKLNGEILTSHEIYHEAACQLVFMGFLHRIVNGGGYIDREYAAGRGRIDLLVRKPYAGPHGERAWQWEAVELKVHHPGRPDPLPDGLTQLDGYLDRLGLETGALVIFDRRPDAPPLPERTTITEARSPSGRTITLLRA
ncbi:ATP-binding protein [Actinomadura barringtoniae]|uniref:ATP-binding protein n=1 Tax=Actinomadura barringtoniae TaxID=1427535 RepID=A0A939PB26_9ACTN|nr:ATP-binding protein [Actinomadura barringtoniae]MBO2448892.1 ATP-binding protein [Actinomadura barringtoniae]